MSMKYGQVALIRSIFNEDITKVLLQGAFSRLVDRGYAEDNIHIFEVPGAVELPLTAQRVARTKRYDGIILLGAVVRGETPHFDYVCEQVSQGCLRVMLDESLPVIFSVLTVNSEEEAMARVGGAFGHKGEEGADALCAMLEVLEVIA